ncbi:hypothetical protein M1146_07050, partial [Patescibacteria group bacterium]|nr:hypothetical protein [Patescibacteria group bacterium]
ARLSNRPGFITDPVEAQRAREYVFNIQVCFDKLVEGLIQASESFTTSLLQLNGIESFPDTDSLSFQHGVDRLNFLLRYYSVLETNYLKTQSKKHVFQIELLLTQLIQLETELDAIFQKTFPSLRLWSKALFFLSKLENLNSHRSFKFKAAPKESIVKNFFLDFKHDMLKLDGLDATLAIAKLEHSYEVYLQADQVNALFSFLKLKDFKRHLTENITSSVTQFASSSLLLLDSQANHAQFNFLYSVWTSTEAEKFWNVARYEITRYKSAARTKVESIIKNIAKNPANIVNKPEAQAEFTLILVALFKLSWDLTNFHDLILGQIYELLNACDDLFLLGVSNIMKDNKDPAASLMLISPQFSAYFEKINLETFLSLTGGQNLAWALADPNPTVQPRLIFSNHKKPEEKWDTSKNVEYVRGQNGQKVKSYLDANYELFMTEFNNTLSGFISSEFWKGGQLVPWGKKFKLRETPAQTLGAICAVWSYVSSSWNHKPTQEKPPTKHFKQPHPIQILCLLLFVQQPGHSKKFVNQLIQVLTGEGMHLFILSFCF